MIKKLKRKKPANAKHNRHALIKKQSYTLETLKKNEGKLYLFSVRLSGMLDALPDSVMLNNKEGRKLVTDALTHHLFKLHEIDWYGSTPAMSNHDTHINRQLDRALKPELNLALAKNQLKLYYQMQVDSERRMVAAEALLRWEHPRYGLILPEHFMAAAEQSGLILPIGAWVLKNACEQLKQWQNDPLKKNLSLSVNISPSQFNQPDFVEQLQQLLAETSIKPERLTLELNERLLLHNFADTVNRMKSLQALGVRFSLDNFGTGYSSLNQLKKLPIDQLKIGQFLMRDIATDHYETLIVKIVIEMTRKLGINAIASGVETEQQFASLNQLGCPIYQGYLFGQPMPIGEFESRIDVGQVNPASLTAE
ncbi:MAG: putative bifunctional diguanylate cyclase/phosphodiesterase [Methylobacter sp.]